jgi:NitT/TauT family transport system substrate-binding protein
MVPRGFSSIAKAAACAFLLALSPLGAHAAASRNVRLMMDWLIQGTHAPFAVAQNKGYFEKEGLNASIDSGKGSVNVAVSVASGAYQFGLVDFPTLVSFNKRNPGTPLVAVYIYFDGSPLSIISRKSAPIRTPADLNGKKIAGGPGVAAYDSIGLLIKPSDHVTINWVPIQLQLFAPMFLRGSVDGMGGFLNSMIPAAVDAGMKLDDLQVLKFSDFGVNTYGLALVTTRHLIETDPEMVRGVVKAVNHGLIDTIAAPHDALKVLLAKDAMLNPKTEELRLSIALSLIDTPHVQSAGLSSVEPKRLQETVDGVLQKEQATGAGAPTPASVYTDAFLPPIADRMVHR